MKTSSLVVALLVGAGQLLLAQGGQGTPGTHGARRVALGDWPEARGPNRDGVSKETGLIDKWALNGQNFLWRAPYGEHNGEIRAWAAEPGYRHVGWTRDAASREDLDSRDWVADPTSSIYRSSREIRDRILGFGQGNGHGLNGGIVLMHLGTGRRSDPAHARLPEILDGLAARGYRLVTISDLLRDAPPPPAVARLAPR
jgi:peptidoglycan/xylan/chitin deacetylase (PgdA/CDA1 family)